MPGSFVGPFASEPAPGFAGRATLPAAPVSLEPDEPALPRVSDAEPVVEAPELGVEEEPVLDAPELGVEEESVLEAPAFVSLAAVSEPEVRVLCVLELRPCGSWP
jgi:hypothetical protein